MSLILFTGETNKQTISLFLGSDNKAVKAATHYHTGAWQKNDVISLLLYNFHSSTLGLNGNEALCCCVLMGKKPTASDWSMIAALRHIKSRLNIQLSAIEARQVSIVNTY